MEQIKQAYAYRDQYGLLHCVEKLPTARQYAKGEIKPILINCAGGFPCFERGQIWDYGQGEIYYGGNKQNGHKLTDCEASVQKAIWQILAKIDL